MIVSVKDTIRYLARVLIFVSVRDSRNLPLRGTISSRRRKFSAVSASFLPSLYRSPVGMDG